MGRAEEADGMARQSMLIEALIRRAVLVAYGHVERADFMAHASSLWDAVARDFERHKAAHLARMPKEPTP